MLRTQPTSAGSSTEQLSILPLHRSRPGRIRFDGYACNSSSTFPAQVIVEKDRGCFPAFETAEVLRVVSDFSCCMAVRSETDLGKTRPH